MDGRLALNSPTSDAVVAADSGRVGTAGAVTEGRETAPSPVSVDRMLIGGIDSEAAGVCSESTGIAFDTTLENDWIDTEGCWTAEIAMISKPRGLLENCSRAVAIQVFGDSTGGTVAIARAMLAVDELRAVRLIEVPGNEVEGDARIILVAEER